jgi:hypothetical protein
MRGPRNTTVRKNASVEEVKDEGEIASPVAPTQESKTEEMEEFYSRMQHMQDKFMQDMFRMHQEGMQEIIQRNEIHKRELMEAQQVWSMQFRQAQEMQQPAARQQQENTEVASTNIRNMDTTVTDLDIEMPNTNIRRINRRDSAVNRLTTFNGPANRERILTLESDKHAEIVWENRTVDGFLRFFEEIDKFTLT